MKYRFELEMPENKLSLALELLKTISFFINIKASSESEIANEKLLNRIEAYEHGEAKTVPFTKRSLRPNLMRDLHLVVDMENLCWWVQHDLKMLKKIFNILENTCKTPFEGIGKPKPLKSNFSGYWSRRINQEHRMVYKVESDKIVFFSLHGHFS
jgi:toxin YoeB